MAKIGAFHRGIQNIKEHPTEVDCFWQVLTSSSGEKLLHLTTFGSSERAAAPKSSQSLQLDSKGGQILVDLIRSTFPDVH